MSVPRFWREIPQRYTLRASECGACGRMDYPPRRICPDCRRDSLDKMTDRSLAGKGTVIACTQVHRPAPGYDLQSPYWIALIRTIEGPHLIGQIVEAESVTPEAGMQVVATFRRLGSDGEAGVIHYGIKWRPDPEGSAEAHFEEE